MALALPGCASLPEVRLPEVLTSFVLEPETPLLLDRPVDLVPPESLHVVSTESRQISLAWEPVLVGDVAGYAILRAPAQRADFELIGRTPSRFGTVFTDSGIEPVRLGDGETYFYRIHPIDSQSRISRSHALISATTDPPPGVPHGLQTYSNLPRRVVLRWEASDDRSVAGYSIYRSPSAAGPWELVTAVDGRLETIFDDEIPGDLRVMYYRLRALNTFGGESDMGEPVRAVTKADPLPPLGLGEAERRLGEIVLAWQSNVEPDIVRYEIHRSSRSAEDWADEALLGEVDGGAERFTDRDVGCGQQVRYRIRAIDADGLTSGYSEPLKLEGVEIGLAAAEGELRWDASLAEQGWSGARLERLRRVLPNQALGEVRDGSSWPLDSLSSGRHRISVRLLRGGADVAAGDGDEAPACVLTVEIP